MYLVKNSRSPFYIVIYQRNGKLTSKSTGLTVKSQALKFLADFKPHTEEKSDPENISLNDFSDEYVRYASQIHSKTYVKSIRLSFSQLIKSVGNVNLKSLNTRVLDKFFTTVFSRAKYAAGLYYRTLKAGLSKAVEWNYIDSNPLTNMRLPKLPKPNPIFLTTEELQLILSNTESNLMRDIFLLAFYTGLRLGEIVNMKWSWIDFKQSLIIVKISNEYVTKNKQERIIPITSVVREMILSRYNNVHDPVGNSYVFYRINGTKLNEDFISKYFKKVVRRVGLREDIHFHTLRHSFASNLVQKGVSIYAVKELLGHKSIVTTMIYSHLNRDSLIKAISCLE